MWRNPLALLISAFLIALSLVLDSAFAGGQVQHADDIRFAGSVAGGDIAVFTNQARTQVTGIRLVDMHLPCLTSQAFSAGADYDPPVEANSVAIFPIELTAIVGGSGDRLDLYLPITIPAPDLMGGYIMGGGGSSCDPPYPEQLWWTASPELANPTPTSTSTGAAFPVAGGRSDGQDRLPQVGALLVIAVALVSGAGVVVVSRQRNS